MDKNTENRLKNLVNSAKEAVKLLTEEVSKPIDDDLQDDKARNAFKAKKECFTDAKDLILEIEKIEAMLAGETEEIKNDNDTDFKAGAIEKFAKRPSK